MTTAVTRFLSLFEPNANVTVVTATATATAVAACNFPLFRAIRIQTTLSFRRYSSSSASVIADDHTLTTAETAGDSQQVPWPEWVAFVNRLKAKGYINQKVRNHVAFYKDMRLLKEGCLSFGRDRFDLFKSLSMQDVQALVQNGCPNIHRQTVNSGKRLRAHFQLDEADACGACVFRGSCDMANVILKDVELGARTADVVRILLNYALDPVADSDKKPFGAEVVSTSAKKLLMELTELSDMRVNPELRKPAAPVAQKAQSFEFKEHDSSRNVEMKRNWLCPKCNFLNFARNKKCRDCDEDSPQKAGNEDVEMKKGDWFCPRCNFLNYSRNIQCLNCEKEGPKRVVTTGIEIKKGDWSCPKCRFINFACNTKCLRCREHRPKKQQYDGEWEFPQ